MGRIISAVVITRRARLWLTATAVASSLVRPAAAGQGSAAHAGVPIRRRVVKRLLINLGLARLCRANCAGDDVGKVGCVKN